MLIRFSPRIGRAITVAAAVAFFAACGQSAGYTRGQFHGMVFEKTQQDIEGKVGKPDQTDASDPAQPGSYAVYITTGERWNGQEKRFVKNAGYLLWGFPQYTFGALGYGYSMTFVPQQYSPNWYIYNLNPIHETEFPTLS